MIYWVNIANPNYSQTFNTGNIPQNITHNPRSEQNRTIDALKSRILSLQNENQQLKKQIDLLKMKKTTKTARRVIRRSEQQLQKNLACPFLQCKKEYASSLALNLHMKLKHNSGTKKQRQKTAKRIIEAQQAGREQPKTHIKFPPGYLKTIKQSVGSQF